MAYADTLRAATATNNTAASLIEGIFASTYGLTFTTWAPTYSGSGSLTYTGVTTLMAKYIQVGKLVFYAINASGTTGGTTSTTIIFTLPVTASAAAAYFYGGGVVVDTGSTVISGVSRIYSTTQGAMTRYDAANWSLGAARSIACHGFYEAA